MLFQDTVAVAPVQQAQDVLTSLAPVFTAVIGVLARFVVVGLKAASAKVRALPEWQQIAIGALVACGLTVARHYVPGLELSADVDTYTVDAVSAIGSTLVMAFAKKRASRPVAPSAGTAL